ncbi:hypothetical protein ABE322_29720 [Priestia megaterium]
MRFPSPIFNIRNINIGTVESASCVNIGNNYPSSFTSNKKQLQGFGSISGDYNNISEIFARVCTKSQFDMINQMKNFELGAKNKSEDI